jgi:hypothetical protein
VARSKREATPANAKAKATKKRRAKVARQLTPVLDSPADDRRWYASSDQPHEAVYDIARKLLQDGKRGRVKFFRELFLDEARGDVEGFRYPQIRARFNVVRNVCETLLARAGKHQPAPQIHTVGGVWKVQRRAKAMGRFVAGDWERLKADRMRRDQLLDCLITGVGLIKVYPWQGQVAWSRIRTENWLAHPRELLVGRVRTRYEIAVVPREVLAAEWADNAHEILNGTHKAPAEALDGADDEDDDLVLTIEAWHLPYAMDDNGDFIGGRHVVITPDCTLEDGSWDIDRFPVSELHMPGDTLGRNGIGYPERLAGLQAAQNRLAETADEVARLMPPKYALLNTKLMEDQVTNLPAEFLSFAGQGSVSVLSANVDLMACMQAAAMQRAEMYRIEGISEDSAQGTVPTNLDSGKAQLVHRDSNAERHVEIIQRVEENTCDLCRLHIDTCEMIAASGDAARLVVHTGGKLLDELKYTDVTLGKNPYVVRVAPINKFANSPEGLQTQLMELASRQLISMEEFRRLYDLPDLDRSNDLAFAGQDKAMQLVEAALDGKTVTCNRHCDKPFLLKYGWQSYAIADIEGADDSDLERLLDLLGQTQSLIDQELAEAQRKAVEAQAGAMPPAMPPPDAPAPPPAQPAGPIGLVS